ncbi:MAG: hypothetical protein ABIJ81_04115 [Patescibacteria group bacterium]
MKKLYAMTSIWLIATAKVGPKLAFSFKKTSNKMSIAVELMPIIKYLII